MKCNLADNETSGRIVWCIKYFGIVVQRMYEHTDAVQLRGAEAKIVYNIGTRSLTIIIILTATRLWTKNKVYIS